MTKTQTRARTRSRSADRRPSVSGHSDAGHHPPENSPTAQLPQIGPDDPGYLWARVATRPDDDPRVTLCEIHVERLEDLLVAHRLQAMRGDVPATNIVLKILDQQARLLNLYDRPRPGAPRTAWQSHE